MQAASVSVIIDAYMPSPQEELDAAVDDILNTVQPKKIILAGAGAGKTTTFKRLLERLGAGDKEQRLVATFLSGLKKDLEKDLHHLAQVITFHGYCHALLRNDASVRNATSFTENLFYAPQLGQLIKSDWVILENRSAPAFLPGLRNLRDSPEVEFFLARGHCSRSTRPWASAFTLSTISVRAARSSFDARFFAFSFR